MSAVKLSVAAVVALMALITSGVYLPAWAMFLVTMAFAKGLVSLGIICLMRAGLVSFGQGLYYCIGAYIAALMSEWTGITDIAFLTLLGVLAAVVLSSIFGPLLANYRGIFFAMLTLSLSMILYGTLAKLNVIGGTDGLNVASPTFFGYQPSGRDLGFALFVFTCVLTVVACAALRVFFDSERGLILLGIRENELRIEYLGASVQNAITVAYIMAAGLAGAGGVIAALAIGHVDPEFSFWTTSGEFVFVGILSGFYSVGAVFVSSVILELVRSFSNLYFPTTWQMSLGVFLLIVIYLLPNGLGSLLSKRDRERKGT
ncbi:ABC transporter permease [Chromatiales bacterium (ex Bugula neritina AB1)]|nr:ABC transporter permease [Chromatiales bacterium (ex Bugula neritina AB1)]